MKASRDTTLLHPLLQERIVKLQNLCKAKGLPLLITETLRTPEYQDYLYAQGRTRPGAKVTNAKGSTMSSAHLWGVAFDFAENDSTPYDNDKFFRQVGELGESVGLRWGGRFNSMPDMPHFELAEFMPNNSTSWLKSNYGTLDKFKASWASGNIPAAPKPTLRQGSSGTAVKELQEKLNAKVNAGLVADGDFGAKTKTAVELFQKLKGLTADGVVVQATWNALN